MGGTGQQASSQVPAKGRPGLVSVITIFWNADQFLSEAIESLLAQTYRQWELLLVDDGSTDRSALIAARYVESYPDRIRYVTHSGARHLGTAASRNLGLAEAAGEFVAFLDSDDVYLPERLEKHVAVLQSIAAIDMVQSEHAKWHTWQVGGQSMSEILVRPRMAIGNQILNPPEGLLGMLAVPSMVPGICDVTVRCTVARELGYIDPNFRLHFEDQIFISKIYLERVVCAIPEILALYRRHPLSSTIRFQETTALFDRSANAAMRSFYIWLRRYVADRSIEHALLSELLGGKVAYSASALAMAKRGLALMLTRVKRVLRSLDMPWLYRRFLRWEHRMSWRRARRRYRGLVRRISEHAAHRAGARRVDE